MARQGRRARQSINQQLGETHYLSSLSLCLPRRKSNKRLNVELFTFDRMEGVHVDDNQRYKRREDDLENSSER